MNISKNIRISLKKYVTFNFQKHRNDLLKIGEARVYCVEELYCVDNRLLDNQLKVLKNVQVNVDLSDIWQLKRKQCIRTKMRKRFSQPRTNRCLCDQHLPFNIVQSLRDSIFYHFLKYYWKSRLPLYLLDATARVFSDF